MHWYTITPRVRHTKRHSVFQTPWTNSSYRCTNTPSISYSHHFSDYSHTNALVTQTQIYQVLQATQLVLQTHSYSGMQTHTQCCTQAARHIDTHRSFSERLDGKRKKILNFQQGVK